MDDPVGQPIDDVNPGLILAVGNLGRNGDAYRTGCCRDDPELADQIVVTQAWTPAALRGKAFGRQTPAMIDRQHAHQIDDRRRVGNLYESGSELGLINQRPSRLTKGRVIVAKSA